MLIVTIISISLLVGLIFYVFNVGDQVNRRLDMQATADAVAVTGAGWMARNMNIIAMDNVAQVKMLSLVPLLDAQPLATEMAFAETTSWWEGLRDQVSRGIAEPGSVGQMLLKGLSTLHTRMGYELDILRPFNDLLNGNAGSGDADGFDMEAVTHWQAKGGAGVPSGTLWQAALALEDFSRAAWASAGVLAQERAGRLGQENGADVAFVVPVVPELPAIEGTFLHFRPTLRNRLRVTSDQATIEDRRSGGAIPDYAWPHRLGPWARLHRWRDAVLGDFIATGAPVYTPGTGGRVRGGGGNVNVSGRTVGNSAQGDGGDAGRWDTPGYREQIGYTTFGPFSWAKRDLSWWANGNNTPENRGKLADTFYYRYVRDLANTKLDYMFPPDGGIGAGAATQTQLYHYPQWITDYPACVAKASDASVRVTRTLFYKLEIASKYPLPPDGSLPDSKTYRTNWGENADPIALWADGWQDPDKWGIQKVCDYVWKDEYTYETTADPEIGIYPLTNPPDDPNGEEVWQPVYMYVWYVFGGIDVGGDVEIINPCNWDDPGMLPVPILLDIGQGDYESDDPDQGYRRERFMYMGVVRKNTSAPVWSSRFYNASKLQAMITVAQAKVFNNKSWDLWTQDWRAHLAPVTGWQDWMSRMAEGAAGASQVPTVSTSDIETIHEYLSALDPDLAAVYMNH